MTKAFDQSLDEIARLVKHYRTNRAACHAPGYKEAHARQNLIDPLFIALDWDVYNTQRAAPQYQPVVPEDSLEVEGGKKAPDYTFRIGRDPVFFAEAKKPAESIKANPDHAYQLRRYAWSAKLALSILTDFEELAVYDCRTRPSDKDKVSAGRINYLTFEEYPDRWRELWDVFAYDAVRSGSFDQYAASAKGKRGTSEVDAEFLKEIEHWRDVLARNIALRNPRLTIDELNDAVQRTIDRIIFLRMAEDRGIEPYGRLLQTSEVLETSEVSGMYTRLIDLCRAADARYNAGLFDFSPKGDALALKLKVDDSALKPILSGLYYPQSPYEFSVLPAEILGSVYEQFLGKVIRLTASHHAKVEEKPEVKKAGGVYYTPAYIVEYIVKNTVGKLVEGKSPKQLEGFRVLDMACGSGSFLLGAYQYLLDYYLKWYVEHNPAKHPKAVWQPPGIPPAKRGGDREGEWRLTTAEKKRILTTHIFGVDIDRQAVEVTKLSLLLKVLEGESDETLGRQLALFPERALPNLDANIKCGNSLIGPDYFTGQLMPDIEELKRVNPFDWEREFPDAMKAGGFDAVIGNPPWGGDIDRELDYFHAKFPATTQEHTDSFKLFTENGLRLARIKGLVSMIVPNTILRQRRLRDVRMLILQHSIVTLVDLGENVFKDVVAPSCVYVIQKGQPSSERRVQIASLAKQSVIEKAESLARTSHTGSLVSQDEFLENADLEFMRAFNRFGSKVVLLGDFDQIELKDAGINYQRVKVGMREKGKSDLAERLLYEGKRERAQDKMYWKGSDIDRYWIAETTERFCRPDYRRFIRSNEVVHLNEEVFRAVSKILLRQTADHIIATADYRGVWFGRSVIAIVPAKQNQCRIEYYLGLLNSRYIDWLYRELAQETGRVFAQVKLSKLKQLPIRPINFSDPVDKARHDKMVSLVQQMLELHKRLAGASAAEREVLQRQIDATDQQIDRLVYNLYGLSDEEIRIVEEGAR